MGVRRRWLLAGLGAAALGAAAFLLTVRPIVIPLLLALAIAYLIAPAVAALERRGFGRSAAILTVYAVLGALAGAAVLRVLPSAYGELQRLAGAVPEYAAQLRALSAAVQERFRDPGVPRGLRDGVDGLVAMAEARAQQMLESAVNHLFAYLEWGAYLVLAPIIAYYLLKDQERFKRGAVRTLPRAWRAPAIELLRGVDGVLAGFVRGQLLLAAAVGVLATLAAYLLGLRYALLLGLWAAACELVPYVGPLIGAVPALLAGLMVSPWRGLQVAVAYLIIQQLESAVLAPLVMGEHVGLHPLSVVLAILLGGALAGIPGMLLAVPLAGMARVVWLFACRRLAAPRVPAAAGRAEPPGLKTSGSP